MKTVHIFNEVDLSNAVLTVSKKQYKELERLEYLGGFKRFGLSVYDEGKHLVKSHKNEIVDCLNKIFGNKSLLIQNL